MQMTEKNKRRALTFYLTAACRVTVVKGGEGRVGDVEW